MPHLSRSADPTAAPALQVLILDDERFDRHRLARLCSGLPRSCTVANANNVEAFVTALDAAPYDLILVDYQLPDGTGLEALSAVRMSAHNLNAATIMVTGQPGDEVAQEAMAGGCADYLTKDELTPATFQRAVVNALQRSQLSTEVETQSFARTEVEAVLQHFAVKCARDIKPMVSRVMRQLRDLRSTDNTDGLDAIDQSCMAMWEMLVALERHEGVDMIARTLNDAAPAASAQPSVSRRKPPSPFARITH